MATLTARIKNIYKEQAILVRLLDAEYCAQLGSPYNDDEHKSNMRALKGQLEYEKRKLLHLERRFPELKKEKRHGQ